MDVEDVRLENSEYCVRIMGAEKLFTALLNCNASNLVFEILKHDKIWGENVYISVLPHAP